MLTVEMFKARLEIEHARLVVTGDLVVAAGVRAAIAAASKLTLITTGDDITASAQHIAKSLGRDTLATYSHLKPAALARLRDAVTRVEHIILSTVGETREEDT